MSGLYLYCLLPDELAPPDGLRGVADAPVALRRPGRLSCWVSPLAGVPDATIEGIRRHNAVNASVLEAGVTPLPVRFGQWLASEALLEERLRASEDAYLRALERVQGAVELGVRVLDPALEPVAPSRVSRPGTGNGTAYLRSVAARLDCQRRLDLRGREIAESVRVTLGSIVREERIDALRSPHGLVGMAHLVERAGVAAYRERIEAFGHEHSDLRFYVSGPWPPYSFAA